MDKFVEDWLYNPTIGKMVAAFVGVLIVVTLVKVFQKSLSRRIKDSDTRYRTRKFVTFFGYLLGILVVATVFSDKLGGLTIAFGLAGAGIAFALQGVLPALLAGSPLSSLIFSKLATGCNGVESKPMSSTFASCVPL